MTFQEERLQFLHDTIYYYGNDPKRRSIIKESWGSHPRYRTIDGRSCAIGRHMSKHDDIVNLRGSIKHLFLYDPQRNTETKVDIQSYLPDKIYMLGLNFLSAVAALHDKNGFWNGTIGLSDNGQNRYHEIVEAFCSPFMVNYDDNF